MKFDTPADAVKAIYAMRQSNLSALMNIEIDGTPDMVLYAAPEGFFACRGSIEARHCKSIAITSIDSVDPKLTEGDRVLDIVDGDEGHIVKILSSYCVVRIGNTMEGIAFGRLVKLPDNV